MFSGLLWPWRVASIAGYCGNHAETGRDLVVQIHLNQVYVVDDGGVLSLPLDLIDGSDVMLVRVVDAITCRYRESMQEVGSSRVGDSGFIRRIKTRDDRLRGVGGDTTLRMCGRLQAEDSDKQRSGETCAPQQEVFHLFSPNQVRPN